MPKAGIDVQNLLKSLGGNTENLAEIASAFESELPDILYGLDDAIARRDARQLAAVAHKMKDSMLLLCDDSFSLAEQLEREACAGSFSIARTMAAELKTRFVAIAPLLSSWARKKHVLRGTGTDPGR